MYTVNWSFWSPCLFFFFDNDWLIEVLKLNISTGEAYSSARICLCISRLCGLLLVSSPLWFPNQRRMNLIAWPEPFYLHSQICTCVWTEGTKQRSLNRVCDSSRNPSSLFRPGEDNASERDERNRKGPPSPRGKQHQTVAQMVKGLWRKTLESERGNRRYWYTTDTHTYRVHTV